MKYINLKNTRTEKQRLVMEQIKKDGVCPFCPEYFARYHDKPIILENDTWIVTENFQPYEGARVHLLFIHKKHFVHIDEIPAKDVSSLFDLVSQVNKIYKISGGTLIWRYGDTKYTGGSVSHLHAQLVSGDADNLTHNGVHIKIG